VRLAEALERHMVAPLSVESRRTVSWAETDAFRFTPDAAPTMPPRGFTPETVSRPTKIAGVARFRPRARARAALSACVARSPSAGSAAPSSRSSIPGWLASSSSANRWVASVVSELLSDAKDTSATRR
jgi:hypothetical protein